MKLPSALARLDDGAHGFWLPVFLLWPLMLLLFALTLFVGAVELAVVQKTGFQGLGRFLLSPYEVICASQGTPTDVDASDRRSSRTLP